MRTRIRNRILESEEITKHDQFLTNWTIAKFHDDIFRCKNMRSTLAAGFHRSHIPSVIRVAEGDIVAGVRKHAVHGFCTPYK